jgi:hypothetical protein
MSSLWTFEAFDQDDAERGRHLHEAPPWPEQVQAVRGALRSAIKAGHARFGFDESSSDRNDLRGVIQFPIGSALFDWLFNGRTGYRAQFRIGSENGLLQNAHIISELSAQLSLSASQQIVAHRFTSDFQYKEPLPCTIGQVVASLDPKLSKIWACERLIGEDGKVQDVFVSRTGPKLAFVDSEPWSSLYPEDTAGWLDVKGAFMSPNGAYQLKPPKDRAAKLEDRGSA